MASNSVIRLLLEAYAFGTPMARALRNSVLNVKCIQNNELGPEQNPDRRFWRSEIRAGSGQLEDEFETGHPAA